MFKKIAGTLVDTISGAVDQVTRPILNLPDTISKVNDTLGQGVNLLLDREIRVGVTGLSRSGKTALITSLVNLICSFGDPKTAALMARFKAYEEAGIIYGGLAPLSDLKIPSFPYHEAMAALTADPPRWPVPTDGISEIRLEIRCQDRRWYTTGSPRSFFIDIWDYPGEWLMDLMLLDLSYEDFSAAIRERLQKLNECCDSTAWQKAGRELDPYAPPDPAALKQTVALFTRWLKDCKEAGFSLIVPGRFVLPGELQGAQILEFVPWIWNKVIDPPRHSLYQELKKRYDAYRSQVVRRFYEECFLKLDRQIVLVDCLKALMGGRETFFDVNDTFDVLLRHFNYGSSSLLNRLFSPQIDKVMFAAAKADCVTNDQHENLKNLLQSMIAQARQRVRGGGAEAQCMVRSAIRATQCVDYHHDGRVDQVLKTAYADDKLFFPGEVPPNWSRADMEFFQEAFVLRDFRPPVISPNGQIPMMNLDVLLSYILGDKLQ